MFSASSDIVKVDKKEPRIKGSQIAFWSAILDWGMCHGGYGVLYVRLTQRISGLEFVS